MKNQSCNQCKHLRVRIGGGRYCAIQTLGDFFDQLDKKMENDCEDFIPYLSSTTNRIENIEAKLI